MKIMVPSKAQRQWRDNNIPPLLRLGTEDLFYFEQIKALRAKLESKIETFHVKVLAVTSSIAGEGKTLSCANLGANLASAGTKKVLLIDVDLRKSDLARGMDVKPLPGLSEYLAGTVESKDIVRESVTPGLWIIPAGTRSSDPTDLLAGDRFREFLRQAREKCDIVLLDTPPILPVSDTLIMKDQIDGFLFLFRAGFTPHQMLGQALEDVGEQKVLGVVLNGVETKSQKYYRKYYGKYYNNP